MVHFFNGIMHRGKITDAGVNFLDHGGCTHENSEKGVNMTVWKIAECAANYAIMWIAKVQTATNSLEDRCLVSMFMD